MTRAATGSRPVSERAPVDDRDSQIERILDGLDLSQIEAEANRSPLLNDQLSAMQRTLELSRSTLRLKRLLSDQVMRALVMPLMGSPIGFRTDKDDKDQRYSVDVVRDCVIEAILRGANLTCNEFNIIAGRAYLTKEYFARVVSEFPGMSDLRLIHEVPQGNGAGGVVVGYTASWKINGVPDSLERRLVKLTDGTLRDERIPVRVNSGMIVDAIIGKATRKMLASVHQRITGLKIVQPDGDVGDVDLTGRIGNATGTRTAQLAEALSAPRTVASAPTQPASEPSCAPPPVTIPALTLLDLRRACPGSAIAAVQCEVVSVRDGAGRAYTLTVGDGEVSLPVSLTTPEGEERPDLRAGDTVVLLNVTVGGTMEKPTYAAESVATPE